ncbi:MAG: hypothetical protein Q8R12_00560, partial [bacterium]|nr:hypothetical protein [bacterium]
DLKTAIYSADSSTAIENISKKSGLHIDQMGKLAEETGLVMLGLTHPKDFIPHLVERLGVDKLTARNIAEDINQQIFQKVRESLKKIHGLAEAPPSPEAPAVAEALEGKPAPEPAKPETKPLKLPSTSAEAPIAPSPKPELKPLEIRPLLPTPAEAKPMQSLNHSTIQLPPGLAFEEKTKESIFRTPSETREKVEKPFADIKREMGNTQIDPYREAIK